MSNKSDSRSNAEQLKVSKDENVEEKQEEISEKEEFTVNNFDPISEICLKLYPDQTNVLQATSELQYWLNGSNPLDFINVYENKDLIKENGLHLHYVSLGLTDLYGDGRVHKRANSRYETSGYGYELTIRVPKSQHDEQIPKWPLDLMQALARYTFTTGIKLNRGDHIPNVLNQSDPDKRVKHVLIADDYQLNPTYSRFGQVKFLQIVGCTDDELLYAQQWSAVKILELMSNFAEFGKDYLLTDLNREKSIFELNLSLEKSIHSAVKSEGSNLSFIKSNCSWKLSKEVSEEEANEERDEAGFKSYKKLELNLDLKSAQLIPTIFKYRLSKDKSFILNGSDGCNLILIPCTSDFFNSHSKVSVKSPLRSSATESQLLLNKKALADIHNYLKRIKIKKKSQKDLPIREKFQLEFDDRQDESKNEKPLTTSKEDKSVESECKHKIKIILNIMSDEELNRMTDKQE